MPGEDFVEDKLSDAASDAASDVVDGSSAAADGSGVEGAVDGGSGSTGFDENKPDDFRLKNFDKVGVEAQAKRGGINAFLEKTAQKQKSNKVGARFVGRVAGAMIAAGSGLSATVGGLIGSQAGTAIVGGATATSLLMTAVLVGFNLAKKPDASVDNPLEDVNCGALTDTLLDAQNGGARMVDANQEKMAKQLYAALSGMGMPDENIAGIFGNIQVESGFDPTAVEGIFSEPFTIGPEKKAVEAAGFRAHGSGAGGAHGLGLNQWTGGRGDGLVKFASSKGTHWSDWKTQIAFAIGNDGDASKIYQDMIRGEAVTEDGKNTADDPRIAARYFMQKWERPADHATGGSNDITRGKNAETWFAKMSGWKNLKDDALGSSILDMANVAYAGDAASSLNESAQACSQIASGSNSSAAEAMATIAHPFDAKAAGNDGTDLYKEVHDKVLGKDPHYASCDRGVATAVRWSGTDADIPAGPTGTQYDYLSTSDRWQEVPWSGAETDLQPGDVVITNGVHIAMYLGKDAIQTVWGSEPVEPGAVAGQASCNDHSPRLTNYPSLSYMKADGAKVFRNVKPNAKSDYTSFKPVSPKGQMLKPTFTTPAC